MDLRYDAKALLAKIIEDAEAGEKASGRALAWPRLRPYLPNKHSMWTFIAGSRVLCLCALRGLRWALKAATAERAKHPAETAPEDDKDASSKGKGDRKKAPAKKEATLADIAERLLIGALCAAVAGAAFTGAVLAAGPRLLPYLPIATGIAIPGWFIAAFTVAPEKPQKKALAEPGDDLPDASAEPRPDTPEGRRLAFVRWLEKTTRGTPGIHLDQLHQQLVQQELGRGLPRTHLRPLLDHYQITVQRTLRVGTVAGRTGVSRQAIEAALSATLAPPPPEVESGDMDSLETGSDLHESSDSIGALHPVEHSLGQNQ